jgi:hypothetical protein
VGKPEGKRALGSPRSRCVGNNKIDLIVRETEWGGLNCIDLVQDSDQWRALVNAV